MHAACMSCYVQFGGWGEDASSSILISALADHCMATLHARIIEFHRSETAASLVEYCVGLMLIVVVTIGAMAVFGSNIAQFFTAASTSI
jgi:Flp pilus assembly pilin Flp